MDETELYKTWEYLGKDGEWHRISEEEKNEVLRDFPEREDRIRRHKFTDEEKSLIDAQLRHQGAMGDVNAFARAVFPKALAEEERNLRNADDDWRSVARTIYAGYGDLGNLLPRLGYKFATGTPMSEDYGTENTDPEKEKDVAWQFSRDKFFVPLALATRGRSLAPSARAGAVTGGALSAIPVATDALAHHYLGVETIPTATKEKPLESVAFAGGLGAGLGAGTGRVGALMSGGARATTKAVEDVLAKVSPKVREMLTKTGLLDGLLETAKTSRPVSISRQFDSAKTAIKNEPLTSVQQKEAEDAIEVIRKVVEEEVFGSGGKMRAPENIKSAVKNVAGDMANTPEYSDAVKKSALKRAEDAVVAQLDKAQLNRVNSMLEREGAGVKLTAEELAEIVTLPKGSLPKPTTLTKVQKIAETLGGSVESVLSSIPRIASSASAPKKSDTMKGAESVGKKEGD